MLKDRIIKLLKELVALPSTTHTVKECLVEDYLVNYLQSLEYFKKHPDYLGKSPVIADVLGRSNVFALVKGRSNKTVIFINHHDVVETSIYGEAEDYAYSMDDLPAILQKFSPTKEQEEDLLSDQWLFGRGSNDMKGGMAVQLALLEEYSEKEEALEGSLLFISVADEESFSDGMRSAIKLLEQLKRIHNLSYEFLINCEPNPKVDEKQIAYVGSVGKLLPVVLVQGKTVQVSNYQEGLNPLGILAKLVAQTEGDVNFIETCKGEETLPPIWLFMRDLKEAYDFSICQKAAAYCNILSFKRGPKEVLEYFTSKAEEIAKDYANLKVLTYEELQGLAKTKEGYQEFLAQLTEEQNKMLLAKGKDFPSVTIHAMHKLLVFTLPEEPVILLGFAPPYYPALNSEDMDQAKTELVKKIVSQKLSCEFKQYFLGVSDCSYCGLQNNIKEDSYELNTPLWGPTYNFDNQALAKLNVPFILLGPWGKELHCTFERVNIKSLTHDLPTVLKSLCETLWNS